MFSELDGEIVLFQSDTCNYLVLNDTGTAIWEALQCCPTLDELCETLQSVYEVDRDACLEDVASWLSIGIEKEVVVGLAEGGDV